MDKQQEEFIKLSSAHATQMSSKGVKGDWSIEANITNEKLFTLPKHLSDKAVFAILASAREYELIAWNAGIKFQKSKQNEFLTAKIKKLEEASKALVEENERLATVLDKKIKGK